MCFCIVKIGEVDFAASHNLEIAMLDDRWPVKFFH